MICGEGLEKGSERNLRNNEAEPAVYLITTSKLFLNKNGEKGNISIVTFGSYHITSIARCIVHSNTKEFPERYIIYRRGPN